MPAFLLLLTLPLLLRCTDGPALPATPPTAAGPARTTDTTAIQAAGATLQERFPAPPGFRRAATAPGTFAAWLRALPLQPDGARVHLYDGSLKRRPVHAAVINMDVGTRDLQQCADAVMRLRAEWLYASGRKKEISFTLTNGFALDYDHWMQGKRLRSRGNHTEWVDGGTAGDSRASFRQYLDMVFTYAGTLSLEKMLRPRAWNELAPGDVFIKGGSPGHAVMVMDVVVNDRGEKRFLLAQSYMPAQEIHILKNYGSPMLSPWYAALPGELDTPEWTFGAGALKTW